MGKIEVDSCSIKLRVWIKVGKFRLFVRLFQKLEKLDSFKRGIAKGSAQGYVDTELACTADFLITLPDVLEGFKPKK